MTPRIAVVQHGDFLQARQIIGSGQPEPYFGMAYSLKVLDELLAGRPHLVISLDAPRQIHRETDGIHEGLPRPEIPGFIPETIAQFIWAGQIRNSLRRFAPTHLLLRTGGLLGCRILDLANRQRINTLAIFASFFSRDGRSQRITTDWLIRRLNEPPVFLVGNHRSPATQTMIECGLKPEKAMAWDWPGSRHPQDYPVKQLDPGREAELVYVGNIMESKGVGDVIRAVEILRRRGARIRLTVAGDGPDLPRFKEMAGTSGGVEFLGRIGNADAFALMLRSTFVCVPSRPDFPEGFPLTLTEALASRTPIIASDHPVFVRALKEGEGLRCFRAGDAPALADVAFPLLNDAAEYARLSEQTAAAYARIECKVYFGDLLDKWKKSFGM
jgi:glycosyltransferase involved in cell wall biosynthesis